MTTENWYGMVYGDADDAAANEYSRLAAALELLKTGTFPRFTNAGDRDAKITAPVRGQMAWLGSPGVMTQYVDLGGGTLGWEYKGTRTNYTEVPLLGTTYTGTYNYDLKKVDGTSAAVTINRPDSYIITAECSLFVEAGMGTGQTALGGPVELRIEQSGAPGGTVRKVAIIDKYSPNQTVTARIAVPAGGSCTVTPRISLGAFDCTTYTSTAAGGPTSLFSVLAQPYGMTD